MTTAQMCIPGPNHPDLFDGETPMMLPLDKPLAAYQVRVTYTVTERESATVMVAARNAKEAARIAIDRVEGRADDNERDHDIEEVERLDRPATAAEKRAWLAREGDRHER